MLRGFIIIKNDDLILIEHEISINYAPFYFGEKKMKGEERGKVRKSFITAHLN